MERARALLQQFHAGKLFGARFYRAVAKAPRWLVPVESPGTAQARLIPVVDVTGKPWLQVFSDEAAQTLFEQQLGRPVPAVAPRPGHVVLAALDDAWAGLHLDPGTPTVVTLPRSHFDELRDIARAVQIEALLDEPGPLAPAAARTLVKHEAWWTLAASNGALVIVPSGDRRDAVACTAEDALVAVRDAMRLEAKRHPALVLTGKELLRRVTEGALGGVHFNPAGPVGMRRVSAAELRA